ncbi:MAG TPA: NAD-dependent epimerase/dehydratase family protein [Thermoanaerobaculia bacterium]|jgi:nucleoside-diphosphate-sugar epimerase|nr:NAD-dependent epimerase/dehydratase family protein [Thermoanaerobaculia bacterium]
MKILITGGTGFLGRRIVAELAPRHELRLLVRRGSSRERFPAGAEFAEGDVTDRASLDRAVAGCDAVLHAAALVKILAPREEFDRINVGGLENVLAAVEQARIGRALYVSSFIALGPTEQAPGGVLDESAEPRERPWINDYERTKALSDRLARRAIAAGLPLAVVYPGVIYGPGELTEGNIVVRHILDLVHHRLPALIGSPARRWNYVYVDDVARGIALALEKSPAAGRYVLGGENVMLKDFYATVGRLTGAKIPSLRMPDGLAKATGALQKAWARMRGTTPQLTPDLVEIYKHDWAYDSSRAEKELGYRGRPLAEGLAATVTWLKETAPWQ